MAGSLQCVLDQFITPKMGPQEECADLRDNAESQQHIQMRLTIFLALVTLSVSKANETTWYTAPVSLPSIHPLARVVQIETTEF